MTLEMRGICKSFGANDVLKQVDFSLKGGEICALLGENGAGKSTLMNILGGVLPADRGEILIDGTPVHFHTPADSLHAGVPSQEQRRASRPIRCVARPDSNDHRPAPPYVRVTDGFRSQSVRKLHALRARAGYGRFRREERPQPARTSRHARRADHTLLSISSTISISSIISMISRDAISGSPS